VSVRKEEGTKRKEIKEREMSIHGDKTDWLIRIEAQRKKSGRFLDSGM
jgi:hypothetical protein